MDSFVAGFHEVIPPAILQAMIVDSGFNANMLSLVLAGPPVTFEDLRNLEPAIAFPSGYEEIESWFFQIIQEEEIRRKNLNPPTSFISKLLFFWTGSSGIPNDLSTYKLKIQNVVGDANNLPSAHTCFNQLDVPNYPNKEVFKQKLIQAVDETAGYGNY